jgi:hypothetical protein
MIYFIEPFAAVLGIDRSQLLGWRIGESVTQE